MRETMTYKENLVLFEELPHTRRMAGIDAFWFLSFVAVAMVHCISGPVPLSARGALDLSLRFAVPFFFITSGFFLGRREEGARTSLINLTKRLLPLYAFWLLTYLVIVGAWGKLPSFENDMHVKWILLDGGPGYHLWFMPTLGFCCALLILCRGFGFRFLFGLSACFYGFGLAFGVYQNLLGLPFLTEGIRDGAYPAFFFVVLGYWFAKRNIVLSYYSALWLVVLGMVLQLIEAYGITMTGGIFAPHDVLISSGLYGGAVFLFARSLNETAFIRALQPLGRYTLGMYCVHLLFIWFFSSYFDRNILWQATAQAVPVVVCSVIVTMLMKRVRILRRLIS